MPRVRGLTVVLGSAEPDRLRLALSLLAAQAALGGRARLYLHESAVALLGAPLAHPDDAAHRAAGLPDLAGLTAEARALGVELLACQSGATLAGVGLDEGVEASGLVSLLGTLGDDRLLLA